MRKSKEVRMQEFKAWLIKTVKSLIFPVILTAIIGAGIYVILNYTEPEEEEEIVRVESYEGDGKDIVLESDNIIFTMDGSTTQFTIEVKSTGKIWKSNPDGASSDANALTSEKSNLQSTLLLTYSTTNGTDTSYGNYAYSIENGIYDIEVGDDYIKVLYSIGDVEKTYYIPPVCTEADFEYWTGLMDSSACNMVQQYYKKYDINNLSKSDDKEELLESYPILETEVIYVLRSTTKDSLKKKFEGYFEEVGYTVEDYLADCELDNSTSTTDKPVFNVAVYYRLDGDDLIVEIPFSEIEYKSDYPIYTLTVLPYFGAGTTEDEGFLFVPEGGGATINFNNGRTSQNSYYANVYGWDMALSRDAVVHTTRTYFNTYGISCGDDSFICILEEGASYAAIQADISGRYNSYNYVNAVYSMCEREQYDVGAISNAAVYSYIESLPDESIVQRYCFVDSGDYVDMAKEYQSYLLDNYSDYMTANDDTSTPVVVEIIGAVDKIQQVLGVPVSRPLELTTYTEMGEIIQALVDDGFDNLSVKITGWANGGVNQKILNTVRTIWKLGSKKDLQNTISLAESLGVSVYMDGVTQYAYDSTLLNGFFSFTDAARFVSKERAILYEYSEVIYSQREDDAYYLLHANLISKMISNLASAADEYSAGVSFRDTGMDLSADYYQKNFTSREAALVSQSEQLAEIADGGQGIMINMGNNYAAVYADVITNMDLQGSEYTILDDFVPFYQIALHGYVTYTGEALNITGSTQDELLLSVEYGAGLYFTLMDETAFSLQDTDYTEYFGSDFSVWEEKMIEIYERYNAELGHTFNQQIVDHEKITSTLSCTTYEDGTKAYVNYGYTEVEVDGITIAARDYAVVK